MDNLSVVTLDFTQGSSLPSATENLQAKVFDVAEFNQIVSNQENSAIDAQVSKLEASEIPAEGGSLRAAMEAIDTLNGQFKVLGDKAMEYATQHEELTPSQMLKITVHAQEFLFQSQMTANVANRSAEGIQQLFRQQS
ncbi:MAG: hypothetical protein MI976_30855 [Pseudomonadales bacterium]|nr:hypothetical protein [Pseudomonadales bacterium]